MPTYAKDVNKTHEESQRLRDLLSSNNISSESLVKTTMALKIKHFKQRSRTLRSSTGNTITMTPKDIPMPFLPNEVLLRILRYGVTSPIPVVDPFFKFRKSNATKEEASSRKHLTISFLATSKAFHREGIRYLVLHNHFVFTQVAALQRFSCIPIQLRSTIQHVTLRVVAQYYDDEPRKVDMSDATTIYHPSLLEFQIPILVRPAGLFQDEGVQAYTWTQVSDLLEAMKSTKHQHFVSPEHGDGKFLFPRLKKLRIDLVNFCEQPPFPTRHHFRVVKPFCDGICEELFITGAPYVFDENSEIDEDNGTERDLRKLLKDEGLFRESYPVLVSNHNGTYLKTLEDGKHHLEVVRAYVGANRAKIEPHPRGGFPPKSKYRAERTIWKWTAENAKEPKRWIEFSRKTGIMAQYHEDHEIDSDFEEEDDYDSLDGSEFDLLFGEV